MTPVPHWSEIIDEGMKDRASPQGHGTDAPETPNTQPSESGSGESAISAPPWAHLIADAERDMADLNILAAVIEDAEFLDEIRDVIAERDIDLQQIAMTLRLLIDTLQTPTS